MTAVVEGAIVDSGSVARGVGGILQTVEGVEESIAMALQLCCVSACVYAMMCMWAHVGTYVCVCIHVKKSEIEFSALQF